MSKVNWHADGLPEKVRKAALDGLEEGAILIKTDSYNRTPVDHGNLRDSTHVERHDEEGAVYVGVGGVAQGKGDGREDIDLGYGLYVHQDATAHHTTGEHHFLQKAFDQGEDKARELMKQRVDAVLR